MSIFLRKRSTISAISSFIHHTVSRTLSGTVSRTLAGTVSRTLPGTISRNVAGTVSITLPGTVYRTVAGTVSITLPGTVYRTVAGTVYRTVAGTVSRTLPGTVSRTLSGTVSRTVAGTVSGTLPGTVGNISSQVRGFRVSKSSFLFRRGVKGFEIAKLGISQQIVKALAKKAIDKLFTIQKAVLEPAMQGRDMIGRARTGTGKTLAFGIPIMDKIIQFNAKNGTSKNPLALVLAPTRELARQVDKEFYEAAPNLDTSCVYGGMPIQQQMSKLNQGADIVVCTPGRVIDLLKRGSLSLSQVQFLVLDEADQMLNVGFADDVETILRHMPQKRQTLMFSATMPSWIKKVTAQHMTNPLTIDLVGDSDQKLAGGITLYAIASEMYEKPSIISTLITEHAKGGKSIVFTQTKRDADKLAYAMGKKLKCRALHGDISQNERERTLSGFRDGQFDVLVATDVAARGLDVPNVDLVIHYELPMTSEIFVHRSGRTGRAGKKGSAILIYSSRQMREVKTIERDVGCQFKELTPIKVEGSSNMFNDMDGYSSPRSGGRFGNSGSSFGRPSGGFSSGRSGSSGGFGRPGGFGGGSDRRSEFGSRSSSGFGNKPSGGESRSSPFGEFFVGGNKSTGRKSY